MGCRPGAQKVHPSEKGHNFEPHILIGPIPIIKKKYVAAGSGVWLCTRNTSISDTITENPIFSNICLTVYTNTTSKILYPCFHGQGTQLWCFKVIIYEGTCSEIANW